jgi:hypothetical protein
MKTRTQVCKSSRFLTVFSSLHAETMAPPAPHGGNASARPVFSKDRQMSTTIPGPVRATFCVSALPPVPVAIIYEPSKTCELGQPDALPQNSEFQENCSVSAQELKTKNYLYIYIFFPKSPLILSRLKRQKSKGKDTTHRRE